MELKSVELEKRSEVNERTFRDEDGSTERKGRNRKQLPVSHSLPESSPGTQSTPFNLNYLSSTS